MYINLRVKTLTEDNLNKTRCGAMVYFNLLMAMSFKEIL